MDTEDPFRSRPRDIASWPSEISHFLLEYLIGHQRSGRSGDKSLRKNYWQAISNAIKERYHMTYEWLQCRNHYRVWKTRLKVLCDLQKNSGLCWNAMEMRFNAPLYVWSEFRKKEQKYWKEHRVLPIHLEVAIWLGFGIVTGNEAMRPSEVANEDVRDNSVPVEGLENMDATGEEEIQAEESVPSTPIESSSHSRGRPRSAVSSGREKRKKGGADKISSPLKALATAITQLPSTPIESSSRSRGRPRSAVRSGREKRKKRGAGKISSPLKAIATAITQLVMNDSRDDLADRLSVAIDAIPGINFNKRWRAKHFFMERKNLASLFLKASEEDKPKVLELYMPDSEDIIED